MRACMNRWLTEPAIHVIQGPLILWIAKDLVCESLLNDMSWLVFSGQEEGRVVGHSNRLLHVVRDDNDCHGSRELSDCFFDF